MCLKKRISRKVSITFDNEKAEEIRCSNILDRLKWWRLGSKDEEEHGYRMRQSNFSLKLNALKDMEKESQDLLKQHRHSAEFFSRLGSSSNTKGDIESKTP